MIKLNWSAIGRTATLAVNICVWSAVLFVAINLAVALHRHAPEQNLANKLTDSDMRQMRLLTSYLEKPVTL